MRGRKPYSDAFKHEAVKLVREQGLPRRQVAADLGIDLDTLQRWLDDTAPVPPTTTLAPSAAELVRLRRENEQLRMERDILKRALGIFSRMPE